jgi:chorismate mutase/prephenate dehydratase
MLDDTQKQLREQLKHKDEEIVRLLHERAELSVAMGKLKAEKRLHVYDPAQENTVLNRLEDMDGGVLSTRALKNIFSEILSASRDLQEPLSVAYLGPEASFTHMAAKEQFGTSTMYVPQATIHHVFKEVEKKRAHCGVVPVENSLEGIVKMTQDCLITTSANIIAEIYLPIEHSLMSVRKHTEGVKRVYSHPQALAQCQEWIRKHLPGCSIHEVASTAQAAQMVLADDEGAAIGSRVAAVTYGLAVIEEGVEDCPSNITRFLVIGEGGNSPTGRDKTSIIFGTRHDPGALYRALQPFAEKGISLQKIISHPIRERAWEYLFFVDFSGHRDDKAIGECLRTLREGCTFVKILGSYPMVH